MGSLRILQQNTGLIAIAHRGWMPRKAAVRRLTDNLAQGNWDVIALSEVFRHSERDLIVDGLKDQLPHKVYGPEYSTFPPRFSGGLLLLSRYPLSQFRSYVFRNQVGVDSWCNKGMLLARIRPPDMQGSLILGLIHTQNPDASGLESARDTTSKQLEELGQFVELESSGNEAMLIMGDVNTDYHERKLTSLPRCQHTYPHMMMQFKGFKDLWRNMRPGDPGITFDDHSTFRHGNQLDFDHAHRFQSGQCLDYFLLRQSSDWKIQPEEINRVIIPFEDGLEISDHYGLSLRISG